MSGAEIALLALAAGSAGVGIHLVRDLHRETNGDGRLARAKECFQKGRHEAARLRAELKELEDQPGEGAP